MKSIFEIFSLSDLFILIVYLSAILVITVYFTKSFGVSSLEYFLAKKNVNWMVFGFSVFIAVASSEYFLWLFSLRSVPGCNSLYLLLIFLFVIYLSVKIFWPKYQRLKLFTTPEYIEKIFDRKSSIYFSWVLLLFFILVKTVLTLSLSSVFLQEIFKVEAINTLLSLVLFAGVLALVGGLPTVIHIHLLQAIVLILGTLYFSFAGNNIIEFKEFFNFINVNVSNASDSYPKDFFSVSALLGCFLVFSIWFWCVDQYIVHRALSVNGPKSVTKGVIFSITLIGIFTVLFFNIIVFNGNQMLPASQQANKAISMRHLYDSEKSLLLIGVYSSIMATLASIFHSGAALFTFNSYKFGNPDTSDSKLVLVGRLATTVFIVITLLLVPAIKLVTFDLFLFIFGIMMIFISPVVALFVMSTLLQESNKKIAFRTLLITGIIGITLIITTPSSKSNSGGTGMLDHWNFIYSSMLLFALSCLIIFISHLYYKRKAGKEDMTLVGTKDFD
ncbi:MAG: hypothetical protein Q8933_07385 [Bacteroidota bacterium]|nr:hypothetical protein [Bacteroidota bacterium]